MKPLCPKASLLKGFGFFWIVFILSAPLGANTTIKFATVAPDGTSWMNSMRELDREVQQDTAGRVRFTFYPGGVAGDERDILRKMRHRQIHATGVTGLGIGRILPEARVLDLPFLYPDAAAVDHVHEALFDQFAARFRESGYELLSWAEVGWTYMFSRSDLSKPENYRSLKMWAWEGDPVAVDMVRQLGPSPIPLALSEVLTSLQTGLLDTVYAPPLAALALQWHTRVRFTLDLPIVHSSGALIVVNDKWNRLRPEDQAMIRKLSREKMRHLSLTLREDSRKAMQAIGQSGVQLLEVNPELKKHFEEASQQVQKRLTGDLFTADLVEQVKQLVRDTPLPVAPGGSPS